MRIHNISLLFIILIAKSPGQTTPIIPPKDFSQAASYPVARIVDGDTVVLNINGQQETVRLIGVDTPETKHPTKPVEYYGQQATVFLENLLKGEAVYIETDPTGMSRDKYGRGLAYLYRVPDGLFINAEIVRQGYGHAYTEFPFVYMDQFRELERKARESERGLWDSSQAPPTAPAPQTLNSLPPSQSRSLDLDPIVYLVGSGSKYHLQSCTTCNNGRNSPSRPIKLSDAIGKGFAPCRLCNPSKGLSPDASK